MKFKQKPETERFIEAYKHLLKNEVVKSQFSFCKAVKYAPSSFNQVLKGKRDIPVSAINGIFKEYNVSRDYIFDGKLPIIEELGNKKSEPIKQNAKIHVIANANNNCYIVPVKAFGGFLSGYTNPHFMSTLEKTSFPLLRSECFMFEVEGMSMVISDNNHESFMPGSWVVTTVVESFDWLQKNKCYVFQTVDGIIIKQFNKIDGEMCHLKSLNPEYKVSPIHLKQIKKVYHIEYKINKP